MKLKHQVFFWNFIISHHLIDLNQFSFNPETIKNLKAKEFQGKIKFMVYDGRFYDYFYNYPKLKWIHLFGLFMGIGALIAQIFLDLKIKNDLPQSL